MQKFKENPYPPLKPLTWKKSSNPHEKTKPKNLKQINTHKEKQTEVREKVIWMVLFPTLLATKHTKKTISSFNFVTLYQTCSITYMPWPGNRALTWWRWSRAMEAMHVSIYFECNDMHNNMKRVPKEFMNSIRKNKVGFWVDRKESFVSFGHRAWCLLPWVSWFGAKGLCGVDQREK